MLQPMLHLTHAARTDVGRLRPANEDGFAAIAGCDHGLFAVADGMGGHAAGEVASAMALEIVVRELRSVSTREAVGAPGRVARALTTANQAIHERTLTDDETHGMGTTLSVLLIADGRYVLGQVGDSRIYLLRDGVLSQLTRDHSYVQEMVDAGALTAAQARRHPHRNVIMRCLGIEAAVEPDVYQGDVRARDQFLVATDGLTSMVDDPRLEQLLLADASPEEKVRALISEANDHGGADNITAIVVEVVDADKVARPPADA